MMVLEAKSLEGKVIELRFTTGVNPFLNEGKDGLIQLFECLCEVFHGNIHWPNPLNPHER